MKMKAVPDAGICMSCSTLSGSSVPRKLSHPDLAALADSASSEQYQRIHSIGNDLDSGRNSTDVDGIADIIDLVSLDEINSIQRALACASNAVCSQPSWLVATGPATSTVLQLLHQLAAVNRLVIDIIQASTNERCHSWRTSDSGLTCPAVAISFNTAIEAACGDLTFLVSPATHALHREHYPTL